MVDKEVARNVVGIIGNIISFCLFASPIPTFVEIWKSKSVGEFKPDPYLATIMNCLLWNFYGLPMVHPDSTLLISINSAGLAMEAIYVTIFFLYADRKGQVKVIGCIFIELVFLAILVTCTLKFSDTHEQRSTIVGIICVIFNIVMYASPLTVMRKVITTKSVKYMPFCLSLANFLNGIIWVFYAVIDKLDLFILIANSVGLSSGVIQLALHACYRKPTLNHEDVDKPAAELQPYTADENGSDLWVQCYLTHKHIDIP
ncbi:bidirectional sugar transporter SWEET5 [Hevea brasiliensis]|uniref:bidirectional sugar transporter SWEET5 n=1 Tax=Hevea brasiliensis TaxID=3981 RepID=UPI0025D069B3|nr:bidirectional sugar transporter SWEET5 [Hevea brasiliensis]